jgi:hypothetical protein
MPTIFIPTSRGLVTCLASSRSSQGHRSVQIPARGGHIILSTIGFREWAAFVAQQAAEKALKALVMALGGEPWGHLTAGLVEAIPPPPAPCRARSLSSCERKKKSNAPKRKTIRSSMRPLPTVSISSATPDRGFGRCRKGSAGLKKG